WGPQLNRSDPTAPGVQLSEGSAASSASQQRITSYDHLASRPQVPVHLMRQLDRLFDAATSAPLGSDAAVRTEVARMNGLPEGSGASAPG
ncbi:unnamed protein product, partial [Polarella glacialis]